MKKQNGYLRRGLALFLVFALSILLLPFQPAMGVKAVASIIVDPAATEEQLLEDANLFGTIAQAVEAASDGDTIIIKEGDYSEPITVSGKGIKFVGEGTVNLTGGATVNGKWDSKAAFTNLNFTGKGIFFSGSSTTSYTTGPVSIQDCSFKNITGSHAIALNMNKNNWVDGLTVKNSTIDGVAGTNSGIYVMANLNGTVSMTGNKIKNVGYLGISFLYQLKDASVTIKDNTIDVPNGDQRACVQFACYDLDDRASGLGVEDSSISVTNNSFTGGQYAIIFHELLKNAENMTIADISGNKADTVKAILADSAAANDAGLVTVNNYWGGGAPALEGAYADEVEVGSYFETKSMDTEYLSTNIRSIKLDKTASSIKPGASVTLKATVDAGSQAYPKVVWSLNQTAGSEFISADGIPVTDDAVYSAADENWTVSRTFTALSDAVCGDATAAITAQVQGKDYTSVHTSTLKIPATALNIDTQSMDVSIGANKQITATLLPAYTTDKVSDVVWESSDETIASVNGSGLVTGLASGTVNITATFGEFQKLCVVTVWESSVYIKLDDASFTLDYGKTRTIKGRVDKSKLNTSVSTVTITDKDGILRFDGSAAKNVAIAADGTFTVSAETYGIGTGTIEASVDGKTAALTATVLNPTASLVWDSSELPAGLNVGAAEAFIAAAVGAKADKPSTDIIIYESSESTVASVSETGEVTALAPGRATITATSGRKSISKTVIVYSPVTAITADSTPITLEIGDTYEWGVSFAPEDHTDTITYTSEDSAKVSVDANGKIKANSVTSAPVTVTVTATPVLTGTPKSTSISVSVQQSATAIDIGMGAQTRNVGDTIDLAPVLKPANTYETNSDYTITYTSSESAVASVSGAGLVSALAPGSTTITVKAVKDGKTLTDSFELTVKLPAASAQLVLPASTAVTIGDTINFGYKVLPLNHTDTIESVEWFRSNDKIVVSDGAVAGQKIGSASVWAVITLKGGAQLITDTAVVTVLKAASGLELNSVSQKLFLNSKNTEDDTFVFVVQPDGETTDSLTYVWSHNDTTAFSFTVGTTNVTGDTLTVKALQNGTIGGNNANFTVSARNSKSVMLYAGGSVEREIIATGVELSGAPADGIMQKNDTVQLNAQILPANTTDPYEYIWKSSDESVLTVSTTGLVTAVGTGTASVSVSIKDRYNEIFTQSTGDITVEQHVNSIVINPASETISIGESVNLTATLGPDDYTDADDDFTYSWQATTGSELVSLTQNTMSCSVLAVKSGSAAVTVTATHKTRAGESYSCTAVISIPNPVVTIDRGAGEIYGFNTIQQAVDFDGLRDGDVLSVQRGMYNESVTVTRAISFSLVGQCHEPVTDSRRLTPNTETVISGGLRFANTDAIDRVSISYMTFQGNGISSNTGLLKEFIVTDTIFNNSSTANDCINLRNVGILSVESNTFTTRRGSSYKGDAIELGTVTGASSISGNTFKQIGGNALSITGMIVDSLVVTHNRISIVGGSAFYLDGNVSGAELDIIGNIVDNCAVGITLGANLEGSYQGVNAGETKLFSFEENSITTCDTQVINNSADYNNTFFDASLNYWGGSRTWDLAYAGAEYGNAPYLGGNAPTSGGTYDVDYESFYTLYDNASFSGQRPVYRTNEIWFVDDEGNRIDEITITRGVDIYKDVNVRFSPSPIMDDVSFEIADPTIATAQSVARFTARLIPLKGRKTVLTVTAGRASSDFTVNVRVPSESVACKYSDVSIPLGTSEALKAYVYPLDNTDDHALSWSSSDTGVATIVADSGVPYGVVPGHCTFTVTTDENPDGNVWSDVCTVTVLGTPVMVSASSINYNAANIVWNAVDDATSYNIYRSTSADGVYTLVGSSEDTTYDDSGLICGREYFYKVSAVRTSPTSGHIGESLKSDEPISVIPIPNTPVVTGASGGYNKAKLVWGKIDGATGYYIYRSTSADGTYKRIKGVTAAAYTDSGLTCGKWYFYKVIAYRTVDGENVYSLASDPPTPVKPIPSTPKVSAKGKDYKTIKISWKKISGANGYVIYRSTNPDGPYNFLKTYTRGSYTSYSDRKCVTDTQYYYKVRAFRVVGGKRVYSLYSSYATSKAYLPKPTGAKVVRVSKSSATVSWKKVSGATGYRIYRSTWKDGDYTLVKTVSKSTLKTTFTGLPFNYYYFKVTAIRRISDYKTVESKATSPLYVWMKK